MAKFSGSYSWIFRGFPDLDPDAILRQQPANEHLATEEERQRAWWLWQRRPRGMNILLYGILLGVGAMAHTPFLLLGSPLLFCVFHFRERRYRRWKKDYLRAVARLACGESNQ